MERHKGIPTGQPNSTVLMSSPMIRQSSLSSFLNHSLTGSVPEMVQKNLAGRIFGKLLICLCTIYSTFCQVHKSFRIFRTCIQFLSSRLITYCQSMNTVIASKFKEENKQRFRNPMVYNDYGLLVPSLYRNQYVYMSLRSRRYSNGRD